jgi:hypothetical protein
MGGGAGAANGGGVSQGKQRYSPETQGIASKQTALRRGQHPCPRATQGGHNQEDCQDKTRARASERARD